MNASVYEYLRRVVIALNQLACVVFLGGWPDETISAYMYRKEQNGNRFAGRVRVVIDWLAFKIAKQTEHCFKATIEERLRIQTPPEYR